MEIDAQPNISSRLHVIGLWVAIQLYVEEIDKGNVTGNAKNLLHIHFNTCAHYSYRVAMVK